MNTNTWIKRSEREPGAGDAPVIYGAWDDSGWVESGKYNSTIPIVKYTHWRSIKAEPPPRELTQRERDKNEVKKVFANTVNLDVYEQMLQAIYAERREVLRILQGGAGEARADYGLTDYWCKQARELRARLDEQGAK